MSKPAVPSERSFPRGRVAALMTAALLLAACSAGGRPATVAPTLTVATPTAAAPSPTATATVTATAPAATLTPAPATPTARLETTGPTPTQGGDPMSVIPAEVGGFPVSSGVIPLDVLSPDQLQPYAVMVAAVGRTMNDLTIVQAGAGSSLDENVTMEVIRISGADTEELLQAEIQRWLAVMVEGTETMPITLGSKEVIQVGEQDASFPKLARYVYAVGDMVFTVYGPSDALNAALMSQLP